MNNPLFFVNNIRTKLSVIINRDAYCVILFFLVAFIIRLIPELLVPNYPIGYETITYYAPAMISSTSVVEVGFFDLLNQFVVFNPSFGQFLRAGPLFYVLMWLIIDLFNIEAFLLLKILGPLLYAFLVASFYFFIRRGLNLESRTAFLVTFVLIFQIAALRISWDRYRTVLALIFFFISLVILKKKNSATKWMTIGLFGVLTVLSRDYIGLVMIVTIWGYTIYEKKDRLVSIGVMIPVVLFLFVLFDPIWLSWNSISFGSQFGLSGYGWILQDILSIIVVCYLLILPLVLKGFKKNSILTPMIAWLFLGSFSVVFFPWFAIPGYQRWLMLLVFPFAIYAVRSLLLLDLRKFTRPFLAIYLSVLLIVGIGYSTGTFFYVGQLPNSYVPIHLVQSSIPWEQIDDVKNVLSWIDENALSNSTLLTEERFLGWTRIYLQRDVSDITVLPYGAGGSHLSVLGQVDTSHVYLIWYGDVSFDDFQVLYSRNNIALFEYTGSWIHN